MQVLQVGEVMQLGEYVDRGEWKQGTELQCTAQHFELSVHLRLLHLTKTKELGFF